ALLVIAPARYPKECRSNNLHVVVSKIPVEPKQFAALPPDVRKASGFPVDSSLFREATPPLRRASR
ncbi:MAG TPA: hypothetical protein VII34_12205, partial [Pyrinomonadaceae bacterium]